MKCPVPHIECCPLETNILEWHWVIEGPPNSPYHGGTYHGKLKFPSEYPLKPPSVIMNTPSGRFTPGRRLCLSMSDFHPETWNPMWSVSTILTGLFSFMLDTQPTLGSVESTLMQKKSFATSSMLFNLKNPEFVKLFPDKVKAYGILVEKRKVLARKQEAENKKKAMEEEEIRKKSGGRLAEKDGARTGLTNRNKNGGGGGQYNDGNIDTAVQRNNNQQQANLWRAKVIELAMVVFAACVIVGLGVQMAS